MERRNFLKAIGALGGTTALAGCFGYDPTCRKYFEEVETGVRQIDDGVAGYADLRYEGDGEGPKVQMAMRFVDGDTVLSDWIYTSETFEAGRVVRMEVTSDNDKHQTATDIEWKINDNGQASECR